MLSEIKELNNHKNEDEHLDVIKLEWSLVATILNRFLFCCFVLAWLFSTISVLMAVNGSKDDSGLMD